MRTAADPAQVDLGRTGAACGAWLAGPPGAGDERLPTRTWGKPRPNGLPDEQLGKPPLKTRSPSKSALGAAAVRTGEAGSENGGIDGRRDENVTDARPQGARGCPRGKHSCPKPSDGRSASP